MPTIIARHKVGDINTWLNGHQERKELFKDGSVTSFQTFQDTNDPDSVLLVLEVADMDKLGAMMSDPKNDELKAKHTVIEPIIISAPAVVPA